MRRTTEGQPAGQVSGWRQWRRDEQRQCPHPGPNGEGNLYVSDWGASHQVKVFEPKGALLRTIGKPGGRRSAAMIPSGCIIRTA
jgi:hypothetical protein